jgi:hypothetical protein
MLNPPRGRDGQFGQTNASDMQLRRRCAELTPWSDGSKDVLAAVQEAASEPIEGYDEARRIIADYYDV